MHQKKVMRPYRREMAVSLTVYVVLLFGSIQLGRPMADGLLRTAVLASPMLGFALMIRAIARHVTRIDEYLRQRLLETFALAAAITAGLTFTYGFLETAGFPRLSMFVVWPVMGVAWGIVDLVRCRILQQ
jgi:hypothetical protein